jgi:predicted ester cyclase
MNIYEEQVRKFYSEIWDKKNFEEIPNVLHENFSFRGSLGQEKRGHEGFKEYVDFVHSVLSNYECIIEELVAQPEKVFAKMVFTGIHESEFMGYPATGKQVSWAGAALFTFMGKKVSSLWVLGDLKSLETQLGNGT